MNEKLDLIELAERESETIEWKENVANIDKVIETVVAFSNDYLNLGGGYIVCGAKEIKDEYGFPKVEFIGLNSSRLKAVKDKVMTTCANPTKVTPPIIPKIDELDIEGDPSKKILVFTVDATGNAHTFKTGQGEKYKPHYFVRIDSSTRAATNGLSRELLRRKDQLEAWDKRINRKLNVEDIDQLRLRQYLQDMRLWNDRKSIDQYLSTEEKIEEFIPPLMGSTGIDKSSHPKNFTNLVFGKDALKCADGAYAIFTIFKSEDKSQPIGETQWIKGSIVEQTKKLLELLNIESSIAIDKNSEVPNQNKYPTIALKEAVVNAIVHRDYEIEQPVRVTVFSDRIEIYSPGGLPFNVKKEKFEKGIATASWRNQSLGRIFSKMQLAQHLGSGISRIISSMKEEGSPEPIFDVEDDSVTCILPAHPRHKIMRLLSDAESDLVIKNYRSALKKIYSVLEEDPHNYRALELFCDLNNILETPFKVWEFLAEVEIDFNQIRANTLVIISETLSLIEDNDLAKKLSEKLLDQAIKGRLEERELIKVAYTLKKLGEDKRVIDFVEKTFNDYPNLKNNTSLRQNRARSAMNLAKICHETANKKKLKFELRERAKEELRKYLLLAEKDLKIAYESAESHIDKNWILKDVDFLNNEMKPLLGRGKTIDNSRCKIHVVNFDKTVREEDLEELFSDYGSIEEVTIVEHKKRFAIVVFHDESSASKAYNDRFNIYLNDKKLIVNKYKKRTSK